MGCSITVVDGGSSKEWLNHLPVAARVINFKERNFGKQKARAIHEAAKASGARVILRTEAEKSDVLNHLEDLSRPILLGEADVVIGSRREPEFRDSYPPYAYRAEQRTKKKLNEVVRLAGLRSGTDPDIDFYSGFDVYRNDEDVLSITRRRYKYVGRKGIYSSEREALDGWFHSQVAAIIEAMAKGFRVSSVEIPFKYDEKQRLNEEHDANIEVFEEKRLRQVRVAVLPAIQLIRYLSNGSGDFKCIDEG